MIALSALIHVLTVCLIAFISACSTRFYLYLIGDPWDEQVNRKAIFSFIGKWVEDNYFLAEEKIKGSYTRKNWFMALGACHHCNNVYWTAIIGSLLIWLCSYSFLWLIPVFPLSHFVISWLIKFD